MNPTASHTRAARIGSCVAALILLFAFILPPRISSDMAKALRPEVEAAEAALLQEDWPAVRAAVQRLSEAMARYEPSLRFFFDHEDVDELSTLAEEALRLADMENDELISRLVDVERLADHLADIETFSLYNLF